MHGVNDVILSTGLAVDYEQVSSDAEKFALLSIAWREKDSVLMSIGAVNVTT